MTNARHRNFFHTASLKGLLVYRRCMRTSIKSPSTTLYKFMIFMSKISIQFRQSKTNNDDDDDDDESKWKNNTKTLQNVMCFVIMSPKNKSNILTFFKHKYNILLCNFVKREKKIHTHTFVSSSSFLSSFPYSCNFCFFFQIYKIFFLI